MSNLEKYKEAYIEAFCVEEEQVSGLVFQEIPEWDSVGHMMLIAALEEKFDITFDTDDIINLSSYDIGIEILEKYNIHM